MLEIERFRTVLALLVILVVLIAPSPVRLLVILTRVVGPVFRLLVDRVHRLATGETLVHWVDLVDGLGRRRWVVVLARSASASSSAAAASSSGRLLLPLSCRRGGLVLAVALDVSPFHASVAADVVGARIRVRLVAHDRLETMGTLAVFDAGHRSVLNLLALDLRTRHWHAVVGPPLVHVQCWSAGWGRGLHSHRVRDGVGGGRVRHGGVPCSRCGIGWPGGRDLGCLAQGLRDASDSSGSGADLLVRLQQLRGEVLP